MSRRLQNGMAVTVAPVAGAGVVVVRARLDAGSMYDGRRRGLSALATALIAQPVLGETPDRPALYWTPEAEPTAFANFRWIEFHASCVPEGLPPLLRTLGGRMGRAVGDASDSVPDVQLDRFRAELYERANRLEASDAAAQRIRAVLQAVGGGAFTVSDLEAWREAVKAAAARDVDDPAAQSQALLAEATRAARPPAEELTRAQLNDTARRMFRNGAPVAFVTAAAEGTRPPAGGLARR